MAGDVIAPAVGEQGADRHREGRLVEHEFAPSGRRIDGDRIGRLAAGNQHRQDGEQGQGVHLVDGLHDLVLPVDPATGPL